MQCCSVHRNDCVQSRQDEVYQALEEFGIFEADRSLVSRITNEAAPYSQVDLRDLTDIIEKWLAKEQEFMHETFNLMDKDGSGTVSAQELFQYLGSVGITPVRSRVREVTQLVDPDSSGAWQAAGRHFESSRILGLQMAEKKHVQAFAVRRQLPMMALYLGASPALAQDGMEQWQDLGSRGLKYIDLRPGKGAEADKDAVVRVQWSGRLYSKQGWTYGRCNDPECELRFKVGDGTTIAGLDEGIRGMREGGYRRFLIPPQIAYQEGQELQPLPERDDLKRRLYSTVFNKVRIANGEGATLGTIVLDVVLKRVAAQT
ncbi:unnamed protein product [Cladocopium goreaui]|uniref:peptidylprolyl isomerase n=1 Tax=Cladocopium goreaui TaxID=2562237 RepID=A0A9P1C6D7_9DINO|nr:unnamed protein product [Cladocopium goreaui]